MKKKWTLFLCLLSMTAFASNSDTTKFLDAATNGDLATVKAMAEAGIDLNVKSRYEATALMFAAWHGHLDVAEYLLEKGADTDVVDSFYGFTILASALANDHVAIALMLAEKDPDMEGQAGILEAAVRLKDQASVERALKLKAISSEHVEGAKNQLEEGEAPEIVAILDKAKNPSSYTTLKVKPKDYEPWAGDYHNEEISANVAFAVAADRVTISLRGSDPMTLVPQKDGPFVILERSFLSVDFHKSETGEHIATIKSGSNGWPLTPGKLPEQESVEAPASESTADALAAKPKPLTQQARLAPRRDPVNWPSFRGYQASGVADGQGVPVTWDVTKNENVKWKTPIPGYGTASPIVWEDKIFLVTAVSGKDNTVRPGLYGDVNSVEDDSVHKFIVYGLDKNNGKILWERLVAEAVPPIKRHTKSSQANSTSATDGKHVVSLFGTLGLMVCHDMNGKELWRTELGAMDSGWFFDKSYQWGHSSSPVIHEDRVIVQVDVQSDSYIAAYSLKDGKQLWKTAREGEIPTWGTPTVYPGDRPEVITNGTKLRGYDAMTGEELWTLGPNSEVTVATPILYRDTFIVTAGYPPIRPIYVIKAGSMGDLSLEEGAESSDSIPWMKSSGGTYMPTPIVYGDYLYTCANDGRMTCYKAATGERVYRARISGRPSFTASPIASDGRLYIASEEGIVHVIKAGPKFEEVVKNEVGEIIQATPAISDGMMIIRSQNHLIAVADMQTN